MYLVPFVEGPGEDSVLRLDPMKCVWRYSGRDPLYLWEVNGRDQHVIPTPAPTAPSSLYPTGPHPPPSSGRCYVPFCWVGIEQIRPFLFKNHHQLAMLHEQQKAEY